MTHAARDAARASREDLAAAVRAAGQQVAHASKPSASGTTPDTAASFADFSRRLAAEGVRSALSSLLQRTDYRFISIFRFKDGKATSAVHVDREDPGALQAGEVDDTATYCCYVRDGNGAFVTADALIDSRTMDHVAREVVRTYCGIPIMDSEGVLIGTLCHYDLVPRDPGQLDLELLLQVASALSAPGVVPPYPSL